MAVLMRRVLLLLIPVIVGCSRQPREQSGTASEYADHRVCAQCHPQIAKTYQQTGMARAFWPATPAALNAEDFARNNRLFHKASSRRYEMTRRGDQFFI